MSNIKSMIQNLAQKFAADVLDGIRSMPLEELLSTPPKRTGVGDGGELLHSSIKGPRIRKTGRLPRRSDRVIANVIDRIVSLLGQYPEGLRAENIRMSLDLQAKELPRPLADALAAKMIVKSGQKRATIYRLAGGKKPAAKAKSAKKPAAKAKSAKKPAAKAKPAKKSAAKAKPAKKSAAKAKSAKKSAKSSKSAAKPVVATTETLNGAAAHA